MKTCFKCHATKPYSEFYRHRMMGDGHLGKCKECTKRDAKEHRAENLEKIRLYDRQRAKLDHRVVQGTKNTAAYRLRFPERWRANKDVANALARGELTRQPCWVCGAKRTQGHHPDYSRTLDVVWLCSAHHIEIHLKHPD